MHADDFNLGDLSKFEKNSCPDDQGAFQVTLEQGGTEKVYEAPKPTHNALFLVCNSTQANNLAVQVDNGTEVGAINNVCIIVNARNRLVIVNKHSSGPQIACMKPLKLTKIEPHH